MMSRNGNINFRGLKAFFRKEAHCGLSKQVTVVKN